MAENSGIAWTTHTFNPWIGCTKVGPGCDACYAEAWDRRFDKEHVARHWGPGAPRRRTAGSNWRKVRIWQRERRAALDRGEKPDPVRVFCASLADVFDNEVDPAWRADLWALIGQCPDLEWQLVTKRVGNVAKMVSPDWQSRPVRGLPANVIVMATIVDQDEANRDLDKLCALKHAGVAQHIGVSYEPALGPVDWTRWLSLRIGLDWIIVGGESDQGTARARPFNVEWAWSTIEQGRSRRVPIFVKQLGSTIIARDWPAIPRPLDRAGADPSEWPVSLRVREFPTLGGARA